MNTTKITVISFYDFFKIDNLSILQSKILLYAKKHYVYGTIFITPEGFNGTISGKKHNVYSLINKINQLTNINNMNITISYCDKQPFQKIKVKLKKETISLKYNYSLNIPYLKGEYIDSIDWDNFT